MKYCKKCGQEKNLNLFNVNRKSKDGLRSYCKDCEINANKIWYSKNKEKNRLRSKKWVEENKDRFLEYQKQWFADNKQHRKRYEVSWYIQNKEKVAGNNKKWWDNNPEKRRLYKAAYRCKLKEQLGFVSPDIIEKLLLTQEDRCFYCSNDLVKYHLDHMTPISRGGLHDDSNLCLSCPSCNLRKNAKTAEEFFQQLMEEKKWLLT